MILPADEPLRGRGFLGFGTAVLRGAWFRFERGFRRSRGPSWKIDDIDPQGLRERDEHANRDVHDATLDRSEVPRMHAGGLRGRFQRQPARMTELAEARAEPLSLERDFPRDAAALPDLRGAMGKRRGSRRRHERGGMRPSQRLTEVRPCTWEACL